MKDISTSRLFDLTNSALLKKDWGAARKYLDELGTRGDNYDLLSEPKSYNIPEMLSGIIGDRIELVNMKASNNFT